MAGRLGASDQRQDELDRQVCLNQRCATVLVRPIKQRRDGLAELSLDRASIHAVSNLRRQAPLTLNEYS